MRSKSTNPSKFLRLATICKESLTQPLLFLDSKAFDLKTEALPRTAGPTVYVSLLVVPYHTKIRANIPLGLLLMLPFVFLQKLLEKFNL